jgi:DMSO/TMAO reductase YedYZ molybdopterin-dependent catalytic subunit
MYSSRLIATGVLAMLLSSGSVFAQRSSFEILGDVQKPRSWSVDEVKNQFANQIRTVKSVVGPSKQEITSTGIPLISLLRATELKMDVIHKHAGFNHIVILEAQDGYRSYYAFAELSNGARGENPALLVWEENGKPLPDNEQPFRLRDGGNRGAIYGIKRIIIVDGTKLADSFK